MPGFVGISSLRPSVRLTRESLLTHCAPLVADSTQRVDVVLDTWFAAAAVDYGRGFEFLKPALAHNEQVVCLMAGEVFPDAHEVPTRLAGPSPYVQRAEYILEKYLEDAAGFAASLNGSFAVAIVDRRESTIRLYTDRIGSLPLYYTCHDEHLLFATQLRSLLNGSPDLGLHYSKDAIAELVLTERVWGERTLFTDIKRIPPSSCLTWTAQGMRIEPYREITSVRHRRNLRDWREASDAVLDAIRTSVIKRTSDCPDAHILASGGLDSRLVLGCAPSTTQAVTFTNAGREHSSETKVAIKIAGLLRRRHHLVPRKPDHYVGVAELSPDVVEGMYSFAGCHSLGIHDQLRALPMRIAITGNWFDLLLKQTPGPTPPPPYYSQPPQPLEARRLMRLIADSEVFHRVHHQDLLMLCLSDELREHAAVMKERFIATGARDYVPGTSLHQHASMLTMQNIGAKPSGGFGHGLAQDFVHRCIAIDNGVLDLAASIPNEWKADGQLVRRAIVRLNRQLGWIADANTGLPASLCPPWSTVATTLRDTPRQAAKFLVQRVLGAARTRRISSRRAAVFNQHSSWHNNDVLLLQSPGYREFIETVTKSLPTPFFQTANIVALLENDVLSGRPRFRKLFEAVLTFGLFDREWGPSGRRHRPLPASTPVRVHALAPRAHVQTGSVR